MNEAMNFLVRHYSDQLVISLYQRLGESASQHQSGGDHINDSEAVCVFKTRVELNNMELNEDKMSITVVGTSPMRSAGGALIYYTFDLDLLFTVKL